MGDARGLVGDDGGLDGDLFRIGALLTHIAHGKHRIADRNIADARAGRADHSGKVAPEHIGEVGLRIGLPSAHLPVGAVDAGTVNVDHDLARLRPRVGQIAVLELLWPAVSLNVDRFHGQSPWVNLPGPNSLAQTPWPHSLAQTPWRQFSVGGTRMRGTTALSAGCARAAR